jgi:CRP-like cAMP-binding protein
VALSISWSDFYHVVQQSPRLGFAMVELMARRLVRMQRAFTSIVSMPVSARLAQVFLSRARDGHVELGLTHQELAQTIGTSRETVTALISRFCALGAIEPEESGHCVRDSELLEAIGCGDVSVSPRHPAPSVSTTSALP